MKIIFSIALLLSCTIASAQSALPAWFTNTFHSKKLDAKYTISAYIKPAFIEADLNGDKSPDIAVLITEKATGSKGLMIMHSKTSEHFIFGASKDNDFEWLERWELYTKKTVEETQFDDETSDITGSKTIRLQHPGILIAALMDGEIWAGEVLHWNGKKYASIHIGE